MPMERGLFSRLPPDLWYLVLRQLCQEDMLALAATCHESAEVFRNPQVNMDSELRCC
jgi:F-box domain